MSMTEEAAREKWCPLTFARMDERGPGGAGITQGGPWPCCTSDCMAWEWGKDGWQRQDGTVIDTDREPANYHGGRWVKRGDCGLKRTSP